MIDENKRICDKDHSLDTIDFNINTSNKSFSIDKNS